MQNVDFQFNVYVYKRCNINDIILEYWFAECDEFHFGHNCGQTCFCHHGVCNNINGNLFHFQYFMFVFLLRARLSLLHVFRFKDVMPVYFRSELFTSYNLTIF